MIVKEVRKKFKKGTRKWCILVGVEDNLDKAYSTASRSMDDLILAFSDDEKEKYSFNKLRLGVIPLVGGRYTIEVSYG